MNYDSYRFWVLLFKAEKKKNLCLQKCLCPMALICSDNTSQNELIPVFPLQLRVQIVKQKSEVKCYWTWPAKICCCVRSTNGHISLVCMELLWGLISTTALNSLLSSIEISALDCLNQKKHWVLISHHCCVFSFKIKF